MTCLLIGDRAAIVVACWALIMLGMVYLLFRRD
jgi:hypothetical protein